LVCRRQAQTSFAGRWEFPGGKQEPGETIEQCLIREVREELGIDVRVVVALPSIRHDYEGFGVRLHPFVCTIVAGRPRALAAAEMRWVGPQVLRDMEFPAANGALICFVVEHFEQLAAEAEAAEASAAGGERAGGGD
jgi:A/G-specific adenine glycosylase